MNIPKEEYFSKELDDVVKDFLMKYFSTVIEQVGYAKCTIEYREEFLKETNFDKLVEILSKKILECKVLFGKENADFILLRDFWINEVFKGCSGKIHAHGTQYDAKENSVAIFYYKVPKNSSHFVIIEDDAFDREKLEVEEYSFHEKSNIKVNEGDLIVHSSDLLHGVSEHQSDESRICFVFNFKFANKNV
jgi:hypothetical protein